MAVLTVTATVACLFAYLVLSDYSTPGPAQNPTTVFIPKGKGLSAIIQQLHQDQIIDSPLFYEANLRLRGVSQRLQAGEYEFAPYITPAEVTDILISGKVVQHKFTVPEGSRSQQIVASLKEDKLLNHDKDVGAQEGELLPETYNFTWNEPYSVLLGRMKQAMTDTLQKAWITRSKDHILQKPEQALILASIVEKETGVGSERARVAAVFLNRLKKGMPLQSDPTVIYGIETEHQREVKALTREELQTPSKYNTYLNKGLPPTPICNPGKASIEAVMNPAETNDLYFVADGTGGHVFAETYEEHAQNHQKWRKIRKEKEKKEPSD